jgi:ribonuclease P protein component
MWAVVLASAQRLRRSKDFAAAVRGGRRAARGVVLVHLTVPADLDNPPVDARSKDVSTRAGFIVSKAVGGAVTRNTIRRRLSHLTRERLAGLPPGSTLVVRALAGAADVAYPRLAADLDAAIGAARGPRPTRAVAS